MSVRDVVQFVIGIAHLAAVAAVVLDLCYAVIRINSLSLALITESTICQSKRDANIRISCPFCDSQDTF